MYILVKVLQRGKTKERKRPRRKGRVEEERDGERGSSAYNELAHKILEAESSDCQLRIKSSGNLVTGPIQRPFI